MKLFIPILTFFSALSIQISAQQIVSIDISPTNPTVTDTVYFYVTSSFPSGACEGNVDFGVTDTDIYAYALHCLGSLTVICTDIDTIKLNPLAAGLYNFHFSLSAGYGGPDCTPGIIEDDSQSTSFFVTPALSTEEFYSGELSVFPNPFTDDISIQIDEAFKGNLSICVFDAFGKKIEAEVIISSTLVKLHIGNSASGIYFVTLTNNLNGKVDAVKLIKE